MTQTTPALTGQDLAEAAGAAQALLEQALAGSGLSPTEYVTLVVLARRGPYESAAVLSDFLAGQRQLGLDRADAAELLERLDRRGLIGGLPVALTPAGSQRFAEASAAVAPFTKQLFAGIDADELVVARRVLRRIIGQAEQLLG